MHRDPEESGKRVSSDLDLEAKAFDDRIKEREDEGFIPDLRRLRSNHYFYKSFWREPEYVDLYLGKLLRMYVSSIDTLVGPSAKILDAGCGPGYFSLELARHGHHVCGVDISGGAVRAAIGARDSGDPALMTGSLDYLVASPLDLGTEFAGRFDAILSSGFLHRVPNLDPMVEKLHSLLRPDGILVLHEPQHASFTNRDAFFVLAMRMILAASELWYDEEMKSARYEDLSMLTRAVHREFVMERDPHETGQSPNDLSADRDDILHALSAHFEEIEIRESSAFIYRTLGGLRGERDVLQAVAKCLADLDAFGVENGFLHANYFYGIFRAAR